MLVWTRGRRGTDLQESRAAVGLADAGQMKTAVADVKDLAPPLLVLLPLLRCVLWIWEYQFHLEIGRDSITRLRTSRTLSAWSNQRRKSWVNVSLVVARARRGISSEALLAVAMGRSSEAAPLREREAGDSFPTYRGVETAPREGSRKGQG